MSAFFLSAIIAICIFAGLIHFDPTKKGPLRHILAPESSLSGLVITILFGLLVILSIFLLILILIVNFHRVTLVDNPLLSIILSDGFRNIILGFLFAGVFIHWVSEFHRFDLEPPPPTRSEAADYRTTDSKQSDPD